MLSINKISSLFILILSFVFYINPFWLEAQSQEFGFIELLTDFTALVFISLAVKHKKYNLLLLILSFVFLEEISWGQKYFDFNLSLPGNSQGEFNLHNIEYFKHQNTLFRIFLSLFLFKFKESRINILLIWVVLISLIPFFINDFNIWFHFFNDILDEISELFLVFSVGYLCIKS